MAVPSQFSAFAFGLAQRRLSLPCSQAPWLRGSTHRALQRSVVFHSQWGAQRCHGYLVLFGRIHERAQLASPSRLVGPTHVYDVGLLLARRVGP
jgi:hypothetical protein